MTHSDEAQRRKPRRLGLWLPYAAAAILAAAWSGGWLWQRGEVERRIDATAAAIRAGGGQATWSVRRVYGYPFRIDLDFTGLVLADPSGWGVTLPALKSEAYAFSPTHWIMAAPQGLTLSRPDGGPVTIAAGVLKASASALDQHPPRLALVGGDMTFAVRPGDAPFPLTAAKSLQIYTRAGPADQGAIYVEVGGGHAPAQSLIGQLVGEGPVGAKLDAIFPHASAFSAGWRGDVAAWSRAGGALQLQQLSLSSPTATFEADRGALAVGDDGRLAGDLAATMKRAGDAASHPVQLSFRNRRAWLGSTDIGPAPRAF